MRCVIAICALGWLVSCGCIRGGGIEQSGGGNQANLDNRLASLEARVSAAIQQDHSTVPITANGGSATATIDKRLASIEVVLESTVSAVASLAATAAQNQAPHAAARDRSLSEALAQSQQGAINYQNAGLTSIGLAILAAAIGLTIYKVRKSDNEHTTKRQLDADAQETLRHKNSIDGMRCAARAAAEGVTAPPVNGEAADGTHE